MFFGLMMGRRDKNKKYAETLQKQLEPYALDPNPEMLVHRIIGYVGDNPNCIRSLQEACRQTYKVVVEHYDENPVFVARFFPLPPIDKANRDCIKSAVTSVAPAVLGSIVANQTFDLGKNVLVSGLTSFGLGLGAAVLFGASLHGLTHQRHQRIEVLKILRTVADASKEAMPDAVAHLRNDFGAPEQSVLAMTLGGISKTYAWGALLGTMSAAFGVDLGVISELVLVGSALSAWRIERALLARDPTLSNALKQPTTPLRDASAGELLRRYSTPR